MMGIFNGAKGKVVAFAFFYDPDDIGIQQQRSNVQNELPVVFVKMDHDVCYSVIPSLPNVVPFIEQSSPRNILKNIIDGRFLLLLHLQVQLTKCKAQL